MEVKIGTVSGYGAGKFGSGKWLAIKDDKGIAYTFRVGRATLFEPKFPEIGEKIEVHYREVKGSWVGYKVFRLK